MCSWPRRISPEFPVNPPEITARYFGILHLLDVSMELEQEPYQYILQEGNLTSFFDNFHLAARTGRQLEHCIDQDGLTNEAIQEVSRVVQATDIGILAPSRTLPGQPESTYVLNFRSRHFEALGRVATLISTIPDLGTSFYRVRENDDEIHAIRQLAKLNFANHLYENSQEAIRLQAHWESLYGKRVPPHPPEHI